MQNTKRSAFWDNYKGILIALVVFGHFIYAYAINLETSFAHDLYMFIYSFHMPAFIFSSGYFSRSERAKGKEALLKLMLYYVLFNTLMMVFAKAYLGTSIRLITPYYSYWYLISLICWRLMIRFFEGTKGLVAISLIISILVGYCSGITNEFALRRTLAFFVFFAAGYCFDENRLAKLRKHRGIIAYAVVLFAAASAWYIIDRVGFTNSMMLMSAYKDGTDVLCRILLQAIACCAILGLLLVTPECRLPLLSNIGRYSLLIYLAHRFVTIIFYKAWFPYKTYTCIYIVYAAVATVLLCLLLGNARVNAWLSAGIDSVARALLDRTSKAGQWLKLLLCVLFAAIIGAVAIPKLADDVREVKAAYIDQAAAQGGEDAAHTDPSEE